MKKICLIIPTYNRFECINYYLSCTAKKLFELNIDIIIYDSSTETKTEQLVSSYRDKGYNNIIYEHYKGGESVQSIDYKVYCAYKKYSQLYDYIWFSSDGTVINIEETFEQISQLMNDQVDMIVVRKVKGLNCIEFVTNEIELFRDYCWSMTLLCSVISSSRVAKEIVDKYPVEKGKDFCLWFPSVYFYILPDNNYRVAAYQTEKLYDVNINRTDSFWKESGNALWQWCEVWCKVIDNFPEFYDEAKKHVIQSHDKNTRIFSLRGLLYLKSLGNLSYLKVKQQERYIKRVTSTNIIFFYIIAFFFPRNLILFVRKCYFKCRCYFRKII